MSTHSPSQLSPSTRQVLAAVFSMLLAGTLHAQSTYTWSGGGTQDADGYFDWSSSAHWSTSTPSSPQGILNFAGVTGTNAYNNFNSYSAGFRIFFNAGAGPFTLSGNAINFYDFLSAAPLIENDSANLQTISLAQLDFENSTPSFNANSGSLLVKSPIYLDNNVTLTSNASSGQTVTFAGPINNGSASVGRLTLTGSGATLLSATNNYTGETDINSGTLQIGLNGKISSSSPIYLGSGTMTGSVAQIALTSAGQTFSHSLTINPGADNTKRILAGLNTSGTSTYSGTITTNADFQVNAQAGGTVAVTGQLAGGAAAGFGLVKTGSGTVLLSNTTNTYTGTSNSSLSALGTQIYSGTLGIYGDGSLGLAPAGAYNNLSFTGNGTLQDTANNITLHANRSVSISTGVTATFDTNGNNLTISGNINSSGAVNIVKLGTGVLTVAADNSVSLATNTTWTVQGGSYNSTTGLYDSVLAISGGRPLGNGIGNQLMLNGATVQFTANGGAGYNSARTITIGTVGGAISDGGFAPGEATSGQGAMNPSISINSGAGLSLVSTNKLQLSSVISGSGGLSVFASGTGTVVLKGSSTYTGTTTLKAGTLQVASTNALGSTAGITFSGGTLQYGSGIQTDYSSKIKNSTSPISIDTNGQIVTFGTAIGSSNTAGLVKNGAGTLNLASGQQFTGGVTLNSGTLGIYEGSSLGSIPGSLTTSLTFGGDSTLRYLQSPVSQPINANRQFVLNPGVTATIDVQGYDVQMASKFIGATGALAKNGSGNLTLSGLNTYGGGTFVNAGTLTLAGASALGSTTAPLSVNSASLNLGGYNTTVGTLTLSNASLSGLNLNAGGQAGLSAAAASVSGINTIGISGSAAITPGTYALISSAGGGLSGTFQFAGAQALSVPVNTMVATRDGINFYNFSLANSATTETLNVSEAFSPAHRISIMPLGSSITAGQSAQTGYTGGGYRTQLYQNLVNDGQFTPYFIGSASTYSQKLLVSAGESNHEGHSGYTTNQILNNLNGNDNSSGNNNGYWLAPGNGRTPNYVTLNIGGNDYSLGGANDSQPVNRYDAILSQISTLRPGTVTLATNLLYRGDSSGPKINTYFNPYIPGVVFNHVLAGEEVHFVDLYQYVTPNNSLANISSDGIHPTQDGYNLMGNILSDSIVNGAAYWTGNQGDGTWNSTNGSTTNWASNSAGTADRRKLLNDATTTVYSYPDVYFNKTQGALQTTLGDDTTVRSLNFAAGASDSVSVGGTNTLSIGSGGITVQPGTGAHSISANIRLAADQTWGNVSSNPLTITGAISGTSNLSIVGAYSLWTGTSSSTITQTAVAGTGAIILAGNNTFTGTTDVKSGKVVVSGALDSTGTVRVGDLSNPSPSAILAGSGSIGNVIAGLAPGSSGVVIDPGNSDNVAGILKTGSLTIANGAHLSLQIGGVQAGGESATGYDQVIAAGAVSLDGGDLELTLAGSPSFAPGDTLYLIVNNSGLSASPFSTITLNGETITDTNNILLNGQQFRLVYDANYAGNGSDLAGNDVALLAIPEPSSCMMLVTALGMLGFARKRRLEPKTAQTL